MNHRKFKKRRKQEMYKDTWGLDYTIAKFILPRLKLFKEVNNGHPCNLTEELWNEYLDKMIKTFELLIKDVLFSEDEQKIIDEGLDLFRKYYQDLWW